MKWLLPFLRIWSKDVMLQASSEGKMMIEKKREKSSITFVLCGRIWRLVEDLAQTLPSKSSSSLLACSNAMQVQIV